LLKGIQAVRIENFFILKVANIQCFILIAVEIFHNIIRKLPRTKEIRCCLIFLHPVKNSMLTRAIFIRPDSELIRESVCACAILFGDEENVHMVPIESWKNKNIDGFYTKRTQKGGFSKLCVKIKKKCYIDLLHFSTCKHNLVFCTLCNINLHGIITNVSQITLFQQTSLTPPLLLKCMYQARNVSGHMCERGRNFTCFCNFSIIHVFWKNTDGVMISVFHLIPQNTYMMISFCPSIPNHWNRRLEIILWP
jgi:hypothetical protein